MKLFRSLLIISLTGILSAKAQKVEKRIYTTKSIGTEKAPVIDGKIDDTVWNLVEWDGDFIEGEPDPNTTPTEKTRFKVLYDSKNLYLAIQSFDKDPAGIVNRLSRRDGFVGDRVNVVFDSYHDKRTAFMFTATAAGVKGDEFVSGSGDGGIDSSWNPIWYLKTTIDDEGWNAEMKIPLSQLRFGKAKEQVWGFNVMRMYFRTNERYNWQFIPPNVGSWVSELGELHGLKDLESQKQLEIQPFTVLQYDSYPKESNNPFRDGSDFKINGGLDAKIGVTNDLTLDLTVNPDFGQVEADPAALALDGFEIFFREQRPFFVENKNIFDFKFAGNNDNLFNSRRIGRDPQGRVQLAEGEYAKTPINTTILGAAKFSGKTKDGWSIGVLESVTAKEYAKIDNNGERRKELVEPLTNYFVGRLQKDFNDKNSYIGGMFTATNRDLKGLDFLHKSAYSAGIDFKHFWKNRTFYIEGNLLASQVNGSAEAITRTQTSLTHLFQRVDAGHVEVDPTKTSLTGTAAKFEIGKGGGGGNFTYGIGGNWRSPELELNDIGFLRQADEIRQYGFVNWRILKPTKTFRKLDARFNMFTSFDFDGNYNRIQYELKGSLALLNNWGAEFGVGHKPRILSNTFLRGGPRWRFSDENFVFGFIKSNDAKKFSFFGGMIYSTAIDNSFSFRRYEGGITYQPTNSLRISFSPEYGSNPNRAQYVKKIDFNGAPRYILAEIDQQDLSAAIRINYTINPNLSVQYYGQPFVFKGRYSNFKYVTNPLIDDATNATAERFEDRFISFNDNQISEGLDTDGNPIYLIDENGGGTDYSFNNPDFSKVQFRSNLVVRWEYIPGSEVFLVWSQGVSGFANVRNNLLNNLDNQILGTKKENTFLIKATYRFRR